MEITSQEVLLKRIVIDPKIMVGKPIIRGTRITVEHILRELASGTTPEQMLDLYPQLTLEDIRAACAYAATRLAEERVSLLPCSPPRGVR
jgi:uncharacterized protein (DUF433 family)